MNFHVTKFFPRLKLRKYLAETQLICWNYFYATRFRGAWVKDSKCAIGYKKIFIFMNISLPVLRSGGAAGSAAGRSTCWLWEPLPAWRGGATSRGVRGASQGRGGKGGNRAPGTLQEQRASSSYLSPVLRHLFQGKNHPKMSSAAERELPLALLFT